MSERYRRAICYGVAPVMRTRVEDRIDTVFRFHAIRIYARRVLRIALGLHTRFSSTFPGARRGRITLRIETAIGSLLKPSEHARSQGRVLSADSI